MSSYSEQVKKDARAAADYIREHGWCQYDEINERGEVCMNGAMFMACGYEAPFSAEADTPGRALYDACLIVSGLGLGGALGCKFNDTPGRTKEEVLAVFDRIANS